MPNRLALGLIETQGLVPAIEAADAAAKAAEVVITSVEVTVAAMVTVKMEGELGAVMASVEAGAAAAARLGHLVAAHVIPRPDDELDKMLPDAKFINPMRSQGPARRKTPAVIPNDAALQEMTVVDLRRLAREQTGFALAGREISHANKEELVGLLKSHRDRHAGA